MSNASRTSEHSAAEFLAALNQLGKICMAKGDHDSAAKYFQEVVNFYRREIDVDHFSSEPYQSSICSDLTHSNYQVKRDKDRSNKLSKSRQGQSDSASQAASKQSKSRSPNTIAKGEKQKSVRRQSSTKKNVHS